MTAMTPDGWERCPLRFVAKIGAGDPAPQGARYYTDGIHPFVRTQDVGRVGRSAAFANPRDRVNDDTIREKRLRLWPIGTTLVPKSGASTVLNHRVRLAEPAYVASHLATVVPRDGASDSFLYHVLCRLDAGALVGNSGYPSLNLGTLGSTPLLVPPLAEQRRIAAVLDAIGEVIEASVAVVEAAERAYEALLAELLARGLPGRHASWREAPSLGTLPACWRVVRLGDVAEVDFSSVDKKSVDGETPVELCNYTDVFYRRRIQRPMDFMRATATVAECRKWGLRRGDVLFTKDSETPDEIGVPAYVVQDMPGVLCGYHLGRARPHPRLVDGAFLSASFRSWPVARQFSRTANGVIRFGLTLASTRAVLVPLPPRNEQQAITEALGRVEEAITTGRRERDALRVLEASAREALLTGRVRVFSRNRAGD